MRIILIAILAVILAGCGEMTCEQRRAWSEAINQAAIMQHQQNLAQMQYSQPQLGPVIYPQNQSNYWQEQRARQEFWDNYRNNIKN